MSQTNTRGTQVQPAADERPIVDGAAIEASLRAARHVSPRAAKQIIARSLDLAGLSTEEVAVLLQSDDAEVRQDLLRAAGAIKDRVYGNRLVLFAPLYLSNLCNNNCLYCSFRRDNRMIQRRILTQAEIAEQVRVLQRMGHKRLLVECGESPGRSPIDYVTESIQTIYSVREGNGSIRRVNVNIAATTVEDYRRLKAAGIGTYQLFQETYHRPTYARMHPTGPKADYDWHLTAMDRAMAAGIDDVGLGVLFGLYDYRFEVLGLLQHAQHLDAKFGVGPHTISVPRWRPTIGVDFTPPHPVSDEDFTKLVAILRVAVPYTGMILSTRESPAMRDALIGLGISQISAASATSPGGYREDQGATEQFVVADHRSVDEMIASVCERGYSPSFCTACYRRGRTGETFMNLAKPGDIHELCAPNAVLTFKEYLVDYASPRARVLGEKALQRQLASIDNPRLREETERRLARIEAGERDLYF